MISIIIPAYNEENRIGKTLLTVLDYLAAKRHDFELIVVDDGSSDSTVQVVEGIAAGRSDVKVLRNGANMGKGYSVRNGALASRGDVVFFTDADLATPIEELERFLAAMNGCDVVIGSRTMPGAKIEVAAPPHRELLGRLFNLFVRLYFGISFTDTQCGAKMFSSRAAREIFSRQRLARFAFDVELLYLARLLGFGVKELPIHWFHSADTRVRALPDGLRMLADLLLIRALHRGVRPA